MSRSRSFKVEEDVSMTEKTEEKSLLREVWDALSFSEIRTAMRVALKHMFVKPVTFQYPREKRTIPDAHRGALGLLRYDDGTERCVGCDLCEAACPSRCIKVVSAENPERPLSRYATERSEEHTSELQSLAYLVCRLLLEKKNKRYSIYES